MNKFSAPLATVVAALTLTTAVTPIASAQMSSLSSSRGVPAPTIPSAPTDDRPKDIVELEAQIEEVFGSMKLTRIGEYDKDASRRMDNALEGRVTWTREYDSNVSDYSTANYFTTNYDLTYIRFPRSEISLVKENLETIRDSDLGVYAPYGLAVDTDGTYVFVVISEPKRI